VSLESAGITHEHVKEFFKDQPLLSDFTPLSEHVNVDEVLLNSADDSHLGLGSALRQQGRWSPQPKAIAGNVTRRKSFHELDYLYRAAKQSSKAGRQQPAEHTLWGSSAHDPATALAISSPTKRKDRQKEKGNKNEVPATANSGARPAHRRTELTTEEKELRDEALYASLVRLYELQARLEAEAAGQDSLFGRVGRLFTFGNKGENKGKEGTQVVAVTAGKKKSGDKPSMAVKEMEAAKVRTFASMFSLPSLFRKKENST